MNYTIFNKNRLAIAVGLLLGTTGQAVFAQEANESEEPAVEIIEVQGIRGSLIRAMDIKRSTPGVMDAISAEEMGKFPDSNLAESLQRITGVSVSRANGEGSEITVRGFGPGFNLITLNGRQMPGTGFTRSYSLQHLSSEGVSALEVYKTAKAELPSGGLGATVNIVTSKPLQQPGQRYSFMAKALHDTSVVEGDDVTPEIAGVYSNTFNDDKLGFAVSFSHYQRDFQRQQANIQGWQANVTLPAFNESTMIDPRAVDEEGNRVGNHFFPKDMNYGIDNVENDRTNGQVTLQYAPNDDFTMTLDYTMTNAIVGLESVGWGIWNEFGGNINGYELDENGTAVYADIAGNDGSFTAFRETTEVDAKSIGLNIDWQVTDDLKLNIDYHDSSNEIDNGADKGMGSNGQVILGSDQLITKIYDYRTGEVPHGFIQWQNGTNELMPSEIDSNFSQFIHSPGESTVEQLQIDGEWFNSYFDIPMAVVKFGFARTEQGMSGTNAWSGLRGGPGFSPAFPQIFPDIMFTRHDTGSFLDEFAGGGADLMPNYYYTYDFDEAIARQQAYLTEAVVGSDNVFVADAYIDGIDGDSMVEEVTNSIYLQTEWEFDVKDYPVQVIAGARYEETDVTSRVKQRVEKQVNWVGESEWIMQYEAGGLDNYLTQTGEHDAFLPTLDIRVDLTDDLLARVSWGKTMSRAPLGYLAGGRALTGSPKPNARSGSRGNTNLQPYKSTNLDITLEYYYDEASYTYIGWFKKDVDNFIQNTITETTIDGLHDILDGPRYNQAVADIEGRGDQVTSKAIFEQMLANGHGNADEQIEPNSNDPLIVWSVSQPNNTDAKSVDGVEIAWQHMLGETGFGFNVNATFVSGDVEFDIDSLTQQAPLAGLGDSANLQAFYEKDGLSVKVTYAWRDDYLLGVGQAQGSADAPPQFFKDYGQVDMSINYDINENLTVFFDALNLNNETEQGYGRYQEQFLFARQYGTRYALGVRYGFN